uniref:Uncharacterized protein n=1 Tax=Physcomitrium patens TaxID=3218 RepID=A0A2K1JKJ2_PHYPA|nr:hypothetical protein PHYPA_016894 [Physcomitrium patens]
MTLGHLCGCLMTHSPHQLMRWLDNVIASSSCCSFTAAGKSPTRAQEESDVPEKQGSEGEGRGESKGDATKLPFTAADDTKPELPWACSFRAPYSTLSATQTSDPSAHESAVATNFDNSATPGDSLPARLLVSDQYLPMSPGYHGRHKLHHRQRFYTYFPTLPPADAVQAAAAER